MLNNLSKIILYVLIGITVVVSVLFFWGGAVDEYAEYIEPNYTQALMALMYVFFGIAIVITIVSLLISFLQNFKVDKKTATKPIISIVALLALIGFAWLIADGSSMQILGMIEAFDRIQQAGDISVTIVAGGIKVALITTVG